MKNFAVLCLFFLLSVLPVSVSAESPQPLIEVAYFKPVDVASPSEEDINFIRESMVEVQTFFASEMERHGFGRQTFEFHSEISVIRGKRKLEDYSVSDRLKNEIHEADWQVQNKIDVVFVLGLESFTIPKASGVAYPICWVWPDKSSERDDCNWFIAVPIHGRELYFLPVIAHEIAHAFGLHHSFDDIPGLINVMKGQGHITIGEKEELRKYGFRYEDARFMDEWGRLSIVESVQSTRIAFDTDVNDDGYTDLYDCLIVRSAMSIPSNYDTDVNNDGVTNILDLIIVKNAAIESIVAAGPTKRRIRITTWGGLKKETRFGR